MPRIDAPIKTLMSQIASQGRVTRQQADQVLDAALNDKVLSPAERKELAAALQEHKDKFEPEARAKVETFLKMSSVTLRNAAHAASKDGVIDLGDAQALVGLADKDGKISSGEKYSLRALMVGAKLTDDARAAMAAKVGGVQESGGSGAATLDVGLPEVDGSAYRLSPDGHFQVGAGSTPARYDAGGALAAYRAASALAAAPVDALKGVPADVKVKMLGHVEKLFDAGKETSALPQVEKERMRSAAATTLLAIIQGSEAPAEKGLHDQAIAAYLKHGAAEPLPELRASMYFNLTELRSKLSPAQVTDLNKLRDLTVPQKPAYEQWFANNGNRTINAKHYAHEECWQYGANPIDTYTRKGFKMVENHETETPKRWIMEGTNPNAPGGAVKMKVEIIQSHDGIFETMDDPKTNAIFYTGHSNLGGNVSEELRVGTEEAGTKFVMLGMCRGKQNIPEFANKHPNTHFVTTDAPSYFSSMPTIMAGTVDALMGLKDYEGMRKGTGNIWDENGNANYFYPNEERRYALYDLDKDGRVDSKGAARDRLFDVGLDFPRGTKVDLQARDNNYKASQLDGTKVLHAVQFLNTLTTYHVDHGHHSSKFAAGDMDAFLGGGWFEGPKDEAVRIKKETVDGKTMFRVSVNKAYADQSQFALGTLIQYEVARQMLTERNSGNTSTDDRMRALIFAGTYLSYMYCSWDEANGAIRALAARENLPRLNFDLLYKAIEADGHGYVTDAQVKALKEKLGIPANS